MQGLYLARDIAKRKIVFVGKAVGLLNIVFGEASGKGMKWLEEIKIDGWDVFITSADKNSCTKKCFQFQTIFNF